MTNSSRAVTAVSDGELPMFDAYHKWLAIPPGQRPPTYYQLLGVVPEETDPEVLQEAAIRQATHVRTYQTGPHARACIRLLNEIAQARAALLNPAHRAEYDARLREEWAEQRSQTAVDGHAAPTADVELFVLEPRPGNSRPGITRPVGLRATWQVALALAYLGILLAVGGLVFC
jgi:hypothetical protein